MTNNRLLKNLAGWSCVPWTNRLRPSRSRRYAVMAIWFCHEPLVPACHGRYACTWPLFSVARYGQIEARLRISDLDLGLITTDAAYEDFYTRTRGVYTTAR